MRAVRVIWSVVTAVKAGFRNVENARSASIMVASVISEMVSSASIMASGNSGRN